jgi:predicted O-methyltransferase YrrM
MKEASDAILRTEQAAYLEGLEPPRDPLLARMERLAADRGLPISDPEVASFLAVTARACSPKLIIELGTNIGYGAIVLSRAAGENAKVITVELSEELCKTARSFVREAGLATRVEVVQGDAIAVLETLATPIDFAYVDCVKTDYPRYLELLVPRLSERGVIVADNVLWRGQVARPDAPGTDAERARALGAFNEALVRHPSLRGVVLPLGDGVAYAVKTGGRMAPRHS